jgi:Tfp pilus assembly protein PilE
MIEERTSHHIPSAGSGLPALPFAGVSKASFFHSILLDWTAQWRECSPMKRLTIRARGGFTRVELAVIIVAVALLAVFFFPALKRAQEKAWRISCLSNLKEIGTGYRLWVGEGVWMQSGTSMSNGGWMELLSNSNAGQFCWTNYAIMRTNLGDAPAIVVCPADERQPAKSFTNGFDNTHVSYFVGVYAYDVYPQSIAGGDRNLGPGLVPASDYGYSPVKGKGNDVVLSTNSPVCWSLKMHSHGDAMGAGNILLGDGAGEAISSASLRTAWLRNAGTGTNGIRLVFP